MSFLSWLRERRRSEPSAATIEAKKRLDDVARDDARVAATVERQERIIKENHLGPAIARALRGKT